MLGHYVFVMVAAHKILYQFTLSQWVVQKFM